ncbi:MAG: ATP-binding protein [Candidatus Omnitrophica bacterium]|nr:ATP-binding protein [Candidatus Omnitrophota bacterium]
MKEIVVISGKGGTGKTVVTAALASLAKDKVMADCDVDAADLHLLLQPKIKEEGKFRSGATAVVDKNKCIACGKCLEVCRFSAISPDFTIDPIACEGCAFCSNVCPTLAIQMKENLSGQWFVSDTRFGPFVHARLAIAEENSGKLVALVKKKAKELAKAKKASFIIVDGSPGIGCPVIASLSGADCALVVTEPTLSGLADAKRVINVAKHFRIPVKLIINKFDLNLAVTKKIANYCKEGNIGLLGKLPFDKTVVEAITVQKTLLEASSENMKKTIRDIWLKLKNQL